MKILVLRHIRKLLIKIQINKLLNVNKALIFYFILNFEDLIVDQSFSFNIFYLLHIIIT